MWRLEFESETDQSGIAWVGRIPTEARLQIEYMWGFVPEKLTE